MITLTACGSAKFKPLVHDICQKLEEEGFTVLRPPLHDLGFSQNLNDEGKLLVWKGATHAHLNRINKSEVCLIVNPGGYLGNSSMLELGYAVAQKKLIVALQPDQELARQSLYDFVLGTENPDEVANKLLQLIKSK